MFLPKTCKIKANTRLLRNSNALNGKGLAEYCFGKESVDGCLTETD